MTYAAQYVCVSGEGAVYRVLVGFTAAVDTLGPSFVTL